MNSQYYKVLYNNGSVHIPYALRKMADLQENSVVRLCVFDKKVIIERVEIKDEDMVKKLRDSIRKQEMSDDAVECFILAALGNMEKPKLAEIMVQLSEMLKK